MQPGYGEPGGSTPMRMTPRLVDWLLLGLVLFEVISGVGTFLVGRPDGRWFFTLHSITGLSLLIVLGWKMARVTPRLKPRRPSVLLSLTVFGLAVLALGTGIIWVSFQEPFGYPNGLNLHVIASLLLLAVLGVHTWMRRKPLRKHDLLARRNLLAVLGASALGFGIYSMQSQLGQRLELRGAARRFTGSRRVEGTLPITMWMFDKVPQVELSDWQLAISGAVQKPVILNLASLHQQPMITTSVTLDCTGGWYKQVHWEGISVAHLLDLAGLVEASRYVSFQSLTGYRWSLPVDEARHAMLALQLDHRPLSAAHGAPLRLVAPGRRGFQWVKWVTGMHVHVRPDPGQWGAIFTSGLNS